MGKIFTKTIFSLLAAVVVGAGLHWMLRRLVRDDARPAGFAQGVVQGALMPLALPNLLAGDDVTIYAASNTGRGYKLGYIVGLDGCGLVFFGYFFWRLRRLRREWRG
ncbi:MAG: hypothetical protein RLZZ350_1309 [Verrucomicrobiota bacterium]|jgi:hypothetical protein